MGKHRYERDGIVSDGWMGTFSSLFLICDSEIMALPSGN